MKVEIAINRLNYIAKKYDNIRIAFSGGKDSAVVYDLCKKSELFTNGKKVDIIYNATTIDPPGTIKFIKENFPDVKISRPELSFFQLVERKGLPDRFRRWCCEYLKESDNDGYDVVVLGVRRAESAKRAKRKFVEKYRGVLKISPIIDWEDKDVWVYIKENNLPIIKYYFEPYNFKRHGCVMCPLATSKQQIADAKLFPRYLKALIKAVKKFRETHAHLPFVQSFNDEYEMVYLWLKQELNKSGKIRIQSGNLFGFSAKQMLEMLISEKLD